MKIPVEFLDEVMAPGWHDEDDGSLWEAVGGARGMLSMGRRLVLVGGLFVIWKEDASYLRRRRRMLRILVALSILETPLARTGRPRFFARFAAQLVWDLYMRVDYLANSAGVDVRRLVQTDEPHRVRTGNRQNSAARKEAWTQA